MAAYEIPDEHGGYHNLTCPDSSPEQVRRDIASLSYALGSAAAATVRETVSDNGSVLCVIVLRGGLLLYPGFAHTFAGADFCLLGMRREPEGTVICEYMTKPRRPAYDVVILADCVAATGQTLLTARTVLAAAQRISSHLAAVICASRQATKTLTSAGMDILGFSLSEDLDGNVVTPDMGELDAGDLFSGLPGVHDPVGG
jgi:uracil phosphoribosyltransferase